MYHIPCRTVIKHFSLEADRSFFNFNDLFWLSQLGKILQVFSVIFGKSGIGSPAFCAFLKFFCDSVTLWLAGEHESGS
jgi:hypothetical protein